MNPKLAFLFWFIMVMIAIANGLFGQFVLEKAIGDYATHIYKTFSIIAVIFVFSYFYVRLTSADSPLWYFPALAAGVQWLLSSLVFEFLVGHYLFRLPWEKLVADNRIWEGRIWSLVFVTEVVAPLVNAYLFVRR
jgi:hypothetical protein